MPVRSVATQPVAGVCSQHPEAEGKYVCRECGNSFCDQCPKFHGHSKIPLCPLCGDLCSPIAQLQHKAERQKLQSSGFGFADLGRAFRYPLQHKIALVFGAAFYGLLQSPVLGTSFYNVMASERSIRDYARDNLFYDHHRVTDRLVANLYATSHQSGAQHAIAAFLSGYLNTDTQSPFSRLTQPVVLVWGKQDATTPLEKGLSLQELNPRARLEVFDYCRMMPEQEQPEKFNALVRSTFLARSAAARSE